MKVLSFEEAKKLLEKYNIPFVKTIICQSKKEAIDFAQKIGFPVVLKVFSPDILHKTDVGGVKIGIENERDLKRVFDEILFSLKEKKPKAKIEGMLIQKQIFGKEVVVGMKRDLAFGPVLMFGLGGIFVEILNDVAFRVAPITKREALKMIREIKSFKILKGFRGEKPVNIEKIAEIIVKVSKLSLKEEKIQEIDLNPIIVNEKEAQVVDARFLL